MTETVRLDLTPEAYETIARASSGDTGKWGIWFPGAIVMILASAGVVALGPYVSDELERVS